MINENVKKLIKGKRFMINCFLSSLGIQSKLGSEQSLELGVTSYYLQSVILELIIKIYYELDLKKEAPYNHKIWEIFNSLSNESKKHIELKFKDAQQRRIEQFKRIDSDVVFHNLEDILKSNIEIIQNFKYNATASNKTNSSADGKFYVEVLGYFDVKFELIQTN